MPGTGSDSNSSMLGIAAFSAQLSQYKQAADAAVTDIKARPQKPAYGFHDFASGCTAFSVPSYWNALSDLASGRGFHSNE